MTQGPLGRGTGKPASGEKPEDGSRRAQPLLAPKDQRTGEGRGRREWWTQEQRGGKRNQVLPSVPSWSAVGYTPGAQRVNRGQVRRGMTIRKTIQMDASTASGLHGQQHLGL